jgi:protein-S-isoprenylcysteine O-methyltransferase Ste14
MNRNHITWVIAQSLFLAAIAIAAPLWPGDWPKALSLTLGTTTFLYAAWTGLRGVASLGQNRTPFPRPRAGSDLVTTGIYAIIRHPLYAAMMAMTLGWACFWSSPIALGITTLFIAFLHAKARFEESLLRTKFKTYPQYAATVPRYLPRVLKH